jgi:hypothetical protein
MVTKPTGRSSATSCTAASFVARHPERPDAFDVLIEALDEALDEALVP